MTTTPVKPRRVASAKPSSRPPSSPCTPASASGYHHLGGSVFKGSRQLMILVEVDCPHSLREEVAAHIVDYLRRRKRRVG